jgi:hypothetical protein
MVPVCQVTTSGVEGREVKRGFFTKDAAVRKEKGKLEPENVQQSKTTYCVWQCVRKGRTHTRYVFKR